MLFTSPMSLVLIVSVILLTILLVSRFMGFTKLIMLPPPHIIKQRIDALPEGPEKERRLIRFRADIKTAIVAYIIAFGVITASTILFFTGIVLNHY